MVDRLLLTFLEEDIGHADITTEGVCRGGKCKGRGGS